ncbi:MAG TPA: hypothetical protein VHG72_13935 [Polyangia bacterium]|nr:hypothetical protein [Polyangia bacterium]
MRPPFNVPPFRPEAAPQWREVWRSIAYLQLVAEGEPHGTDRALCVSLHAYAEAVCRLTLDMNLYFVAAFDVVRMEMLRPAAPIYVQLPEGRMSK